MNYHIRFHSPCVTKGMEYDHWMETRKKALDFYIANLIHYFPSIKILASEVYSLSVYVETDNEDLDLDLQDIRNWYDKSVESIVKKNPA